MKRIQFTLLALTLIFGGIACKSKEQKTEKKTEQKTEEAKTEEAKTEKTEGGPQPTRVD